VHGLYALQKEQRSKLDSKATPWVFVGYGDDEFGYRLGDTEKRKMVRSKDVVFHEHKTIADIHRSKKTTQYSTGVTDVTPVFISSQGTTDGGATLEAEPENTTDDTLTDGGFD